MDPSNTWDGFYDHAKKSGAKFPELVAAQWALESGYGQHLAGRNNFFGLKGKGGSMSTTQEFVNGKWVTIRDGFIDFPSRAACIEYLIKLWYFDYKHYKGVNNAVTVEEAAQMLKSEGYATDPTYVDKLLRILHEKGFLSKAKRRPIKLSSAAKYYKGLSHQLAAWNHLEDMLTEDQLNEFADLYRADP
jgi:flagellum-specific peptidoglycan hydrolase FlgJ